MTAAANMKAELHDRDEKKEKKSLRPVAFAAVVFSTVALTSCLITFPLILHYIQTLESQVQLDLEFCQVSFSYRSQIVLQNLVSCNFLKSFRRK